jgi:hypothetical protein
MASKGHTSGIKVVKLEEKKVELASGKDNTRKMKRGEVVLS